METKELDKAVLLQMKRDNISLECARKLHHDLSEATYLLCKMHHTFRENGFDTNSPLLKRVMLKDGRKYSVFTRLVHVERAISEYISTFKE